jgi:hypothetical protein
MLGLAAFLAGIFALIWSVVIASVGLVLIFACLVPLLILCLFFRFGFALMRATGVFVLLCIVAVWLI